MKAPGSPTTVSAESGSDKPHDSLSLVRQDLTHAFSTVEGDPLDVQASKPTAEIVDSDIVDWQQDSSPLNETEVASSGSDESLPYYLRSSVDGSNFDDGVDSELDAAVLNALQSTDSRLDDDASVSSNASSVVSHASANSVKSAVQLRLESRKKKPAPSQESFDAKLQAATQRKLFFLQGIASKRQSRLEKVVSVRSLVEDRHDAELAARKASLENKLSLATQRKEYFVESKTTQLRAKNTKALSARDVLAQQKDAEADAIREKMNTKIREATNTKENARLLFSEKVQAKFAKISESQESNKQSLKAMSDKIAEKMAAANTRKEQLDSKSKSKVETGLNKKQERASFLKNSKEANVSSKKLQLDAKYEQAAERKQLLIKARKAKVTEYLSRALERGQEAIKRKEEMSLNGEEIEDNMIITNTSSLSSIQEDAQFDPNDDHIGITGADALAWLDDENSVASFSSSASTKSKAQRRLESYKRTTPSKADFDAKLEAAERRREKVLFATKENAGFSAKMDKVSKQMQAAESKIAELSQKFNHKMKAASERKSKHLDGFVREKVVNKNIKLEKAKDRQLAKDTKVSSLEKKLEAKLLAALERKEAIVAAKAAKAAGDISASANRGQDAEEKKEQMMLKIKDKSQKKMNSASKRRKQLRALEKKKKEVMMIRREMAKSMNNNDKIESIQKKLAVKMSSAQERKQLFVDAKVAKASTYSSSVSERGQEITRKRESGGLTKSTLDEKLEAATKRKAELQAKIEEKNAKAKARRERAREIAKQRKAERGDIANWEDESVSASVVDNIMENMKSEDLDDIDLGERGSASGEQKESSSDNSYEEKRLKAKQQLMDEIQLANEVKHHEMVLMAKDMKKSRKPASIRRDISDSGASVQSFGTLDTNEVLSFDGGEVSISGLSTVREEQKSVDRRKAQTALALAELDIKLSEIQIMQAILLAEEASLSGKDEFKTTDASVEDLESVKGTEKFLRQKKMDERKDMVQHRAKQFFASTMKQAKIAKVKAGKTLIQVRNSIEKHEKRRSRPSTAPTFSSRPSTAPSPIV